MPRPTRARYRLQTLWIGVFLLALALVSCWKVDANLVLSSTTLDFGGSRDTLLLSVLNHSEDNLLTSGVTPLNYQFKPDKAWISVKPMSGTCGAMEKRWHHVAIDRALLAVGDNIGHIEVTSNGGSETVEVRAVSAGCTDTPSTPLAEYPVADALEVPTSMELVWTAGNSRCFPAGTATYDVYFGTATPPPFAHDNGTSKTWNPGPLTDGTVYYWRVVAKDANGETPGRVNAFRTVSVCRLGPGAVTLVTPDDGATDVAVTAGIYWGGGYSQCAGLTSTYDVYFGKTSPPPFHHTTTGKLWVPGTLENATKYYWRVVAKDANGSTSSEQRSFTTVAPCLATPSAVTLVAPANGATGVALAQDLSWSGGDSQCAGLTAVYDVYFGTTSPPPLAHGNQGSKTYDPGILAYGTTYYWRIVAKDANGSTSSSQRSFTTTSEPCTAPPGAVTLLAPAAGATGVSIDQNVSWSGGDSQCPGLTAVYDVYFGTTSPPPLAHAGNASKTYDPGTLAYSTTYYWRIVAKDANGNTSSAQRSFTTMSEPCTASPGAVTLLAPAAGATGVSIDQNVSWSGGDSQCPGLTAVYDVYFGTTSPPPLAHAGNASKTYDPGTLAYSTTYYWRIVAKDANGSTSSAQRSFTTVAAPCTAPPSAVTLVSPAAGATGVALDQNVSWSGGDSQCPGLTAVYDVYFGTTSPPPLAHADNVAKTWDPGTLAYSTTYYWRVVAKDANGSTSSSQRSFTTVPVPCTDLPGAVTLVAPADGATDVPLQQDLSWSGGDSQCPALTAVYDIYLGTSSPPPLARTGNTTKTWDPGQLADDTVYYWRVVARDANGTTSSDERSFHTACTLTPTAVSIVSPSNGSSGVLLDADITWDGGISQCPGLSSTYDVYFGTSSNPPFDHNNGDVKTWDPGTLAYGTTYYWKIVAKDDNGSTSGAVWSFHTEAEPCTSPPLAACSPGPSDGRTNVNTHSSLSWGCGTSVCGLAVTYDVYLGTTSDLGDAQKVASTTSTSWKPPVLLQSNTTYYWKIITRDANGETAGPVWSFTTR
ncbi:MAG TPA: hypothetical protein VFH88_02620 [Candidatus Krumholzibacteria bacterium]|nr:hypothetical protein [Candidatus Krumholzibacteria bacterium]